MAKQYEKSRYWAFIYYEESPIKNYKEYFIEKGARAIISPWHDKDVNEDTGEVKKKHKHIILVYDGPQCRGPVERITQDFNSPMPIAQVSLKGAVLYLTHSNNPEKYQYSQSDIELVGFDTLQDIMDLTAETERQIIMEFMKWVEDNQIYEYWDCLKYYGESGLILEFQYLANHTLLISNMLNSIRNKKRKIKIGEDI